ncbi:MAG TPA: NAD-dependent succinate-semialdehyde dehydrogenase [Symbiobacteriaceae bacterium]|nr:NAD-dependent succinate-semialdehyde dehydrogenase [Symbiobacteriaceae bacterium]
MLYIGGEWTQAEAGREFPVHDPATGELVGMAADASAADAERAVAAAAAAFPAWAGLTARERSAFLMKLLGLMRQKRDELATLIAREMGKPFGEAKGEVAYAMQFVEWYAEEAKRAYGETIPGTFANQRIMVITRPVGPVAAITPWNFPVAMVTRKIAPALAAGCTVVLKPAEQTPLTAKLMVQLCQEAGIPAGVVNLITTSNPAPVGEILLHDERIRKVAFTGSTAVGKFLMKQAADGLKRVSLELGGHAPYIVFPDADLEKAAKDAALAKFQNGGQACVAVNRVYVHADVVERFTELLVARVKRLKVGPGMAEGVAVGALVDGEALTKVAAHVADAVAGGAQVACGGEALTSGEYAKGHFFAPTVLTGVSPSAQIVQEETFGPAVPVLTFTDEAEVLAEANRTPYGLAAYLYTRDIGRIFRFSEGLEFGLIGVNEPFPGVAQAPFGGMKGSGMGREGGHHGLAEFMEVKTVAIQF